MGNAHVITPPRRSLSEGGDTSRSVATLLINLRSRREFREIEQTVGNESLVVHVEDLSAACRLLSTGNFTPEIILVMVDRPGQHRADLLDRLAHLAPLCRITLLLGSWCEGEQRTGTPWPGGRRLFWYDWLPHWRREMAAICEGRCPAWGYPTTTTREERLLMRPAGSPVTSKDLLVVCARCFETADALSDAAMARGYRVVCGHRPDEKLHVRGALVAIWEGVDGGYHDLKRLNSLRQSLGGLPIVAMLDFPRIDVMPVLHSAGVTTVVPKPFDIEDLFDAVERAKATTPPSATDRLPPSHSGAA